MRKTQFIALTFFTAAMASTGAAMAGEALYLTPPLFREQARDTQQVRNMRDLSTTPQPVAAAAPIVSPRTIQVIADAEAVRAR